MNPPVNVPVPPGVVTETFLVPRVALAPIVMLAVIWVELLTVNLLTVIPESKLTAVVPEKLVPVRVTLRVCFLFP